ncbi:MAG: head-tail connector protein [Hyphomicrobiaceae bacterium]
MALKLVNGPAIEAITVTEVKEHMRVDHSEEDTLIASYIATSRLHIETALGLSLITQHWTWFADCWPFNGIVEVPLRPLQSVSEIRLRDGDDSLQVIDPVVYAVDTISEPPRIASRTGYWPTPNAELNGIEIDLKTGFGDAANDVPADIRQALLLLTTHWFENRDPALLDHGSVAIPKSVSSHLQAFKLAKI